MEGDGSRTDNFFVRLFDFINAGISRFVAFLFIVVSIGAFYGFVVARLQSDVAVWLLMIPVIAAILSFYNRFFALLFFGLFILFLL